ncbi:cobalamin biosynthesis protein CbiG [Aggregicoccus sp. 17bor-14]|uniref:cobalamin biosynthesis protein CbiG n=1 Tax=Myxococcaceae TaxID=31 RepID=UPI0012EFBF8F|nr:MULTISPECIES: cobalamin biosynthesis protein CbiG [Myxococcaceae]MBF5044778.1 cobalamin biosynthesis protein CbiG [Simulacricoccus sp. 17bor-14]MRI90522.1 cobalamin biosynthesis protein CbiG [Aggregicoccus sp. 17bor-14]
MSERFDTFLIVDWSANGVPKTGRDSIWWARLCSGSAVLQLSNPSTRHEAMAQLRAVLAEELSRGARVLLGVDFALGYPRGLAQALGLAGPAWRALWEEWRRRVRDAQDNANNRFEVAAALNAQLTGGEGPFWGRPASRALPALPTRRSFAYPVRGLTERRLCELRVRGAQPVWKVAYAGSVGGQSLCGLPHLLALREDPVLGPHVRVWPFETGFAVPDGAPCVVLAEVYPSLVPLPREGAGVKDARQVEALARHFAREDAAGRLAASFARPAGLSDAEAQAVREEEGWVLGV